VTNSAGVLRVVSTGSGDDNIEHSQAELTAMFRLETRRSDGEARGGKGSESAAERLAGLILPSSTSHSSAIIPPRRFPQIRSAVHLWRFEVKGGGSWQYLP